MSPECQVVFSAGGRTHSPRYCDAGACLPVRLRGGGIQVLPWGRRTEEAGRLPAGGWAALEAIHAGEWQRWQPLPVKVPVTVLYLADLHGDRLAVTPVMGQCLQGLVARIALERRVYLVALPPLESDVPLPCWPRLV